MRQVSWMSVLAVILVAIGFLFAALDVGLNWLIIVGLSAVVAAVLSLRED